MAAAPGGIGVGDAFEACGRAGFRHDVPQGRALRPHRGAIDPGPEIEAHLQRRHPEHRGRSRQPALHAGGGNVAVGEGERLGMAHPARQRRGEAVLPARRDVEIGGRAGAAVQIFVGAAHREVGAGAVQVDRDRAGRVAEVPQHQRAGALSGGGDGGHVPARGGLVVDVGQHQHRDVGTERRLDLAARHDAQARAGNAGDRALGDVEVGREVARLAQHHAARRVDAGGFAQGGDQRLEEAGGSGIADDDLVRARADQRGDLVAEADGGVDPALIPAADQALAPLARGGVGDRGRRRRRQRAERVAVEVDHAVGEGEAGAHRCEGVGGVERAGVVEGHFSSSPSLA